MKYTINGLMDGEWSVPYECIGRLNIVGKRGLAHSDGKVTIDISYVWNSIEVTNFPETHLITVTELIDEQYLIKLYFFHIISITFVFISFILLQGATHHSIIHISFRMYYILFKTNERYLIFWW